MSDLIAKMQADLNELKDLISAVKVDTVPFYFATDFVTHHNNELNKIIKGLKC